MRRFAVCPFVGLVPRDDEARAVSAEDGGGGLVGVGEGIVLLARDYGLRVAAGLAVVGGVG